MGLAPLLGFSEKLVTGKGEILQPPKAPPSKTQAMSGHVVPAPICSWPSLRWIGQSCDAGVRGPGKSRLLGGVRWSGLSSHADVCGRVFDLHASQLGHSWGAELSAKPGSERNPGKAKGDNSLESQESGSGSSDSQLAHQPLVPLLMFLQLVLIMLSQLNPMAPLFLQHVRIDGLATQR